MRIETRELAGGLNLAVKVILIKELGTGDWVSFAGGPSRGYCPSEVDYIPHDTAA
jgi:hypothetical protein